MSDQDRYRPTAVRGGVVVQSGIDARPRGSRRSRLNPTEAPFRAVVVNSRVVGEDGNLRGRCVECDVLLVRTQIMLHAVPVLQRQHGVNNVHDLWVPRASTRVVTSSGNPPPSGAPEAPPLNLTGTISRRGTVLDQSTSLGDVDGDMVAVDFMEANPNFPVIVGALSHERTNRVLREGDGWREGEHDSRGNPRRDEFYTHHYGCEVRINEQGDFLIDTVGAYSDIATEDASASSGQVRVRVKDTQRLTIAMGNDEDVVQVFKEGSQLRVDLGKNAGQRIPLGDDQVSALKTVLDAIDTFSGLVQSVMLAAPFPKPALTLINYQTLQQAISTAKTSLDNALSDLAKTKKS
jgi:hypothetical protein